MNPKFEICNSFNNHAAEYDNAAKIQREIGERLLTRLDLLKINPIRVLDLGCGTGNFSQILKKRYPEACVIGLDIAYLMLREAQKKQRFWRKWPLVNADMLNLPFSNNSFDLIFANQTIHWAPSLKSLLAEIFRTLTPQGCFLFSTLGPDSFREIRSSWIDEYAHVNEFPDMHDIGDSLLGAQFQEPVMDMEYLTLHYKHVSTILKDIKQQGVRNINRQRNPGLTGKTKLNTFMLNYQKLATSQGELPLTYEVVYGIGWKVNLREKTDSEAYIPLSSIGIRK